MTDTDRKMLALMARISTTLHGTPHSVAVQRETARFDAVLADLRALLEPKRLEKVA